MIVRRDRPGSPATSLHIESIVVDGVAINDRDDFGAALTAELSRLVTTSGLSASSRSDLHGPTAKVDLPGKDRVSPSTDRALARSVAAAVYRSIGGQR